MKKSIKFLSLAVLICMMLLVGCGQSKDTAKDEPDMYKKVSGVWSPTNKEDLSTYTLKEDKTFVYKGKYEYDGAVLTGINSPGTYEISEDGKEITFKEEARDESYTGTLDEEFILHIDTITYSKE